MLFFQRELSSIKFVLFCISAYFYYSHYNSFFILNSDFSSISYYKSFLTSELSRLTKKF